MKFLYLGVYRDGTGYGEAACRYIQALDAAGADVVCRPVKLNDTNHVPPARVLELEARGASGCDVVIQNVLPHQMDYNGRFALNVGLYFSETSSILHSAWNERLNQMDAAWGCSRQMEEAARASHVDVPYGVVPIPCRPEVYGRSWTPPEAVRRLKDDGHFVFYTIGEMVRRKNLAALLKAFHTEFSPEEPVQLVIKTSLPGSTPEECRRHVEAFCDKVKRGLKLYGGGGTEHYKPEVVLTGRAAEDEVLGLHAGCDCFVQPSYGEAWSIPAFDAMAFGRTPVVTDWGGYREYVTPETGWLVPAAQEQVFGISDTFRDLFTGRETWAAVDHAALRRAMREAYEDEGLRRRKAAAGAEKAADFSLERVGRLMLEVAESHAHQRADRHGLAGTA